MSQTTDYAAGPAAGRKRGGVPTAPNRTDREYRRARRHSRLVAVLKIGLPLLALAIVVGGIAVTWLARSLPDNISVSSTSIEDGRVVMQDPRLSGYDGQNRPYSMVAKKALQSLNGGGIDLEGVDANLTVSDNVTATIQSAKGHYDPNKQTLQLFGGLKVVASNGMTIRLEKADVNLTGGRLVGDGPVNITMPNQRIQSGNIVVAHGGQAITFGDRVKMTLLPNGTDSAQATEE